jgi:hypothetical protein
MIVVETEIERGLMTVTYCGHVVAEEFGLALGEIEEGLAELQPGFKLLTDLGGLESDCAGSEEGYWVSGDVLLSLRTRCEYCDGGECGGGPAGLGRLRVEPRNATGCR